DLAVMVITVEEQLSGWYSLLRQSKDRRELAAVYRRLAENVTFSARLKIFTFTEDAISRFEALRVLKLGIATMDLRIAQLPDAGLEVALRFTQSPRFPRGSAAGNSSSKEGSSSPAQRSAGPAMFDTRLTPARTIESPLVVSAGGKLVSPRGFE